MGERWPKIGVALLNHFVSFFLDLGVQLVVARPTAVLGDQRLGAARAIGAPQALHLAHRQAQLFRRLPLGDPFRFQLLHHFRSAQFARAHADEIAHSLRVLSWWASGPCYPRKSVPRLAPGASRRGHFYLGQRGHYYFGPTLPRRLSSIRAGNHSPAIFDGFRSKFVILGARKDGIGVGQREGFSSPVATRNAKIGGGMAHRRASYVGCSVVDASDLVGRSRQAAGVDGTWTAGSIPSGADER